MSLIEKDNIDINQTDKLFGWTALMLASYKGHKEIVKILMKNIFDIYFFLVAEGILPLCGL